MIVHPLSVSFEDTNIRGDVFDFGSVAVVDATFWPFDVTPSLAREVLRLAVEDGRCKVPDDLRGRLDAGKAVLR